MVISEGGSVATLVAEVADVDWNLEQVTVDLSPIGGNVVTMNDRGVDGDKVIGDDKYSTRIIVPGLEVGEYALSVQAVDSFDSVVTYSSNITVGNQAPRMIHAEVSPSGGPRGTNICLLYTSPSPRDLWISRMPSSA